MRASDELQKKGDTFLRIDLPADQVVIQKRRQETDEDPENSTEPSETTSDEKRDERSLELGIKPPGAKSVTGEAEAIAAQIDRLRRRPPVAGPADSVGVPGVRRGHERGRGRGGHSL